MNARDGFSKRRPLVNPARRGAAAANLKMYVTCTTTWPAVCRHDGITTRKPKLALFDYILYHPSSYILQRSRQTFTPP